MQNTFSKTLAANSLIATQEHFMFAHAMQHTLALVNANFSSKDFEDEDICLLLQTHDITLYNFVNSLNSTMYNYFVELVFALNSLHEDN